MIVVQGKRVGEGALPAHERLVIDLGTGDGRYAYAVAGDRPDWLVIGIDAISERLAEYSAKAARKPAKGGRPNLLYVRASAEDPPAELAHQADEVHVILPWGALLVGLVDPPARPDVLAGIRGLLKPGGRVSVVLNAEPWEESLPKDMAALPPITVEHVRAVHPDAHDVHDLSPEEVRSLPSTWAKRLAASHRGQPHFVAFYL